LPRVLVADDDALIRRLLEQTLAQAGYEVVAAQDGLEAMARLETTAGLDVVVTDYSMPGASGLDVVTQARRLDPTLPSIVVTAFRDLDLAMQAMQAGAIGFIPKPFRPEHLLTVVAQAMERRALATEAFRLRLMTPMLERFTMLLSNTLESKDLSTRHHSERLARLAERVGVLLGLDEPQRSWLRLGASLHDIGKVGVPEALLRKPAALSAKEREVMRTHPRIGASILADIAAWDEVRLIVFHHHEHWDGGGYPDGLRGAAIPLGSRIVGVVDAFDVMRSGRVYAPARSQEEAVEELRRERGRQFDPEVVDLFMELLGAEPVLFADYDRLGAPPPAWGGVGEVAADRTAEG
jgi:putative two-component system response regulator